MSPAINVKMLNILPVVLIVIFRTSIFGKSIAFKVDESFYQDQWQFSCHQIWCKVSLIYYSQFGQRPCLLHTLITGMKKK